MLFTGQFSDVGTSNVTEYGFYFGTNGHKYDASPNVRYVVATGVNISVDAILANGEREQIIFLVALVDDNWRIIGRSRIRD